MQGKKDKKEINKLNKQLQRLERAFKKMKMRPCKGDEDLKQKKIDLGMLRKEIHNLETDRDSLIYTWGKGNEMNRNRLSMDDGVVRYLAALKKVNEALLEGLKTSLFVMDNWDDFKPEQRASLKEGLKGLIKQGEEAFDNVPTTL